MRYYPPLHTLSSFSLVVGIVFSIGFGSVFPLMLYFGEFEWPSIRTSGFWFVVAFLTVWILTPGYLVYSYAAEILRRAIVTFENRDTLNTRDVHSKEDSDASS